jgi:plastocyanin
LASPTSCGWAANSSHVYSGTAAVKISHYTFTSTPKAFNSGHIAHGTSGSHTFTKPGAHDYMCAIHPFMTAEVVLS